MWKFRSRVDLRRLMKARFLKIRRAFVEEEKGASAIVLALLLPIIIGGLAFGAELGFWHESQRRLQNAADTAAHAAGIQVLQGFKTQTHLDDTVSRVAHEGGFNLDPAFGSFSVLTPPAVGAYAGDARTVRVYLEQKLPRRFTGIFSTTPVTINAASTVLVTNGRPACVLSLAPDASQAVTASGSTSVTLTGCDIAANSIASDAVHTQGASSLTADCVSSVGGIDNTNGGITITDCPAMIENAPLTADPYADRPEPAVPVACATNAEKNEFATKPHQTKSPLPTSDSPIGLNLGKAYCSSSGTEHIQGTTILSPGVYVLNGGSWTVNSTATLTGTGVTIFLANGATFNINGGATIDLSAPTSGPYSGLVIYFARDNIGSSIINGGANFSLVGAVYGPKQNITFSGSTTGSDPGDCTQIIGFTVTFTGNSDFNTDCSGSGTTAINSAQSVRFVE